MRKNKPRLNEKRPSAKKTEKFETIQGTIIGTKQAYLFCSVEGMPDFFIPPTKTRGALHGDTVLIKVLSKTEESTEAEVTKIIKRANTTLVGELIEFKDQLVFRADNAKISKYISIPKRSTLGALPGQKVVCRLLKQPENSKERFLGEIVEVLGENDNSFVLERAILRQFNIYETFPAEVERAAEKLSKRGVRPEDKVHRMDLTKEEIFTIDGEDAKDFDDAVSLKMLSNGNYYLGVHIADVGHYVAKDSVIDQEAILRGTSVYFPNMTFPMLPEALSNDICSLKENEERLTLSIFIEIDLQGNFIKNKVVESVISSKARLTYKEVFAVLSKNGEISKAKKFEKTLNKMNELAKILKSKRTQAGELDFDLPEPYFILDENQKIIEIRKRDRNDAHELIENFMIAANEVIAKKYNDIKMPFVYRIHEVPTQEKTQALVDFLKNFDITMPKVPNAITPDYYKQILSLINEKPTKDTLNKVVLRSLQKAVYKNQCLGHFGLALQYYCHFTSPIRRYPDLTIHRIIKDHLNGKKYEQNLKNFVFEASEISSQREKNADEAERAVDDLKKCEYMQDKIGLEFEGIITSVNNFGFFVELPNTVEGLVRIETLPKDGYLFFEKSLMLKGAKHTFSIGDVVKVVVSSVNMFERKIDFVLI